ncbi:MAG: hypothetical protein SCH70_13790 [Candidatus Methanoperedens sp.]|nr:hypothetical protein [Candidatus Methanoperedens sp.]
MNKGIKFVIGALLTAALIAAVAAGVSTSDNNLTVQYNYFFGLNPSGNEIIAAYGKLPELETEEQRQNWSRSLKELGEELKDELFPSYMHPHGKILTAGENSRGYFVILFYENLTTEDPLLDELYAIIDKNANNMGIQKVPVEFKRGVYFQEIEVDLDNLSEPEIKAIEEYMKSGGDLYKLEVKVIAAYGKIPKFETREQWNNWVNKVLPAVSEGLGHKISDKYFYPAGPFIAFGYGSDGFEATVLQNLTIEKPLTDEIYGIIDEEAKKRDVREVPVRFVFGDFPRLDILAADDGSNEDAPPSDNPSNKNISDPGKASSKSVPGFGLPGGLISLLGVWLLRKR